MNRLVLEVVTRKGEVVERVRISELPGTIGRGYGNDLILGDPTVDPAHARIVYDPERDVYLLEDLGSLNGVRPFASEEPVETVVLRPGTTVRLGRTRVRVAFPGQSVAPAVAESPETSRESSKWLSWPAGVGLALGFALLMGVDSYRASITDSAAAESIVGGITLLVLLAMWAGVWALVSRFTRGRFAFLSHLAIVSWLAVLTTAMSWLSSRLFYLTGADWIPWLVGIAPWLILLLWMFWAHLGLSSALRSGIRWGISGGIVAVLFGLGYLLLQVAEDPRDDYFNHVATLYPLPASWIVTESVSVWLEGVDGLADELDALAIEP